MKYRTKPYEIEAIRYTGDNAEELNHWTDGLFIEVDEEDRTDDPDNTAAIYDFLHSTWVGVKPGQWIISGGKGEYYPCDNEVFNDKYEAIV